LYSEIEILLKASLLNCPDSQPPVAYIYNPSYSGGRDQEDRASKPARANSSLDSYLENTQHIEGLVEWLK
jgi:hypothetical protein